LPWIAQLQMRYIPLYPNKHLQETFLFHSILWIAGFPEGR